MWVLNSHCEQLYMYMTLDVATTALSGNGAVGSIAGILTVLALPLLILDPNVDVANFQGQVNSCSVTHTMTTLGMAKDQLVKVDLTTSRPPESVGGSVVGAHDPEDSAAQGCFGALITVQSKAACFRRLPASSDFCANSLQTTKCFRK